VLEVQHLRLPFVLILVFLVGGWGMVGRWWWLYPADLTPLEFRLSPGMVPGRQPIRLFVEQHSGVASHLFSC
jgi:hypothetical protein